MYELEEVVSAFELWRAEKPSTQAPIPERLWVMVRTLLPHHKKTHIQRALRLSGEIFNKHCGTVAVQQPVPPGQGFAVGTFASPDCFHDSVCEMTLKGRRRTLQIKLPIDRMAPVLSLLETYL